MSLAPGIRLGPYEILAPIGAGGMGEVYRARDTRLGREVAIKVLPAEFASDPERLRRFEQEAKATAALDHPNILAVYDIGTHEGTPYIVEQLLEGESLRQRLRAGPLPPAKAVEFAIQIASGLAAAHEKGIVHRDLKPDNLFVTTDGRVKILDFGLARLRPLEASPPEGQSEAPTADSPTREGRILGTPGYMSPEQVRGRPVDARTDIFAFGVVLYEMLAGKQAFAGDTAADTQAAILAKDPDPLPLVTPQSLDRVVRRCLEKRPEDRYLSAHELLLALEVASTSSAPPSQAPVAAVSEAREWPRRRWVLASALALPLATALAGVLLWHPWKTEFTPAITVSATVPSLVALPCKVLGSPESAYLTDAIPNTISTILGEVQGLDTKVPPTSLEVEKVHGDMNKIAEAYGVQTFVLSTVTAEGDHLVFNIQVADAITRKIRWGHRYEGTRANYTAMAQEAAQGICRALLPEASPAVMSGSATNSEAELAYQEGRFYWGRFGAYGERTDWDRAMASYQRALTLNPKLAVAAVGIAWLYHGAIEWAMLSRTEGVHQAESWGQKALAIDPRCGAAWSEEAALEFAKPDPSMDRWLEGALKGAYYSPTDNFLWLAVTSGGSADLAIQCKREDVRRSPLDFAGYMQQAGQLTQMGRAGEALPMLDRSLSLSSDNAWALAFKIHALVELGNVQEATALLEEVKRKAPRAGDLGTTVSCMEFDVALAAGDEHSARATAREVIRFCSDSQWTWSDLQSWEAVTLPSIARKAGREDALELFQLCSQRGAYIPYDMLMLRPDLKELREDARADEGVRQTKAWFARTIKILQDARAKGELPKYLEKPMDDLLKDLESRGAWP